MYLVDINTNCPFCSGGENWAYIRQSKQVYSINGQWILSWLRFSHFNFFVILPRSPEAKKRKVPPSKDEATNGPAAKKAKTSAESSSSEESSSEDEEAAAKPTKAAPAGSINMFDSEIIHPAVFCQ